MANPVDSSRLNVCEKLEIVGPRLLCSNPGSSQENTNELIKALLGIYSNDPNDFENALRCFPHNPSADEVNEGMEKIHAILDQEGLIC